MFCKLEKFPGCILRTPAESVVLLSGGQDSTVTLALASRCSSRVVAVSFDYGQQHQVELRCADKIAAALGAEHLVLPVPALEQLGHSALLGQGGGRLDVRDAHPSAPHLPASFVPGRNGLFLQLAAAVAFRYGYTLLWGGWCQTDYSGYPDCRYDFLETMERALRLGLDASPLTLCAPLLFEKKAAAFRVAHELGPHVEELVLEHSMTCYRGDRSQRHAWGYGCENCPACELRRAGYLEYLADAPLFPS